MTGSFVPRSLRDAAVPLTAPQAVVEAFLAAMAAADTRTVTELLDEHVLYVNVGMPPMRGRRATMKLLRTIAETGPGSFEVYLHAISADGPTVLTERTDVLVFGPVRLQFWVTGRFDVRDGQITLWRDSFDYLDLFRSVARGLAGAVLPALRPSAPTSADVAPGRH